MFPASLGSGDPDPEKVQKPPEENRYREGQHPSDKNFADRIDLDPGFVGPHRSGDTRGEYLRGANRCMENIREPDRHGRYRLGRCTLGVRQMRLSNLLCNRQFNR